MAMAPRQKQDGWKSVIEQSFSVYGDQEIEEENTERGEGTKHQT